MSVREYAKRWPNLYYTVVWIFGPAYLGGLSPRKFIKKYSVDGHRLNIGSGPRHIGYSFQDVDIFPYPNVEIVADAISIPLPDNSIAMIISDNVLEHVADAGKAAAEIKRLLKPGGVAYISTPFVYPFHSSPSDFNRWTAEGLKKLFSGLESVEIGVRSGPFSVLTVYLCYLFSSILCFGSHRIYELLNNVLIFIFFPIKYLDLLANHLPFAEDQASVFYFVVRKS